MKYLGAGLIVAAVAMSLDVLNSDGASGLAKRFGEGSVLPVALGIAVPSVLIGCGLQLFFWKRAT